jgi:hypothetical protein
LGMVTSVLDCASYIRGRHFVLECDHQALKPLFQKQLKGAIYERWLAILQQFDVDIEYKPAAQMCVPGALSRNPNFPTSGEITVFIKFTSLHSHCLVSVLNWQGLHHSASEWHTASHYHMENKDRLLQD